MSDFALFVGDPLLEDHSDDWLEEIVEMRAEEERFAYTIPQCPKCEGFHEGDCEAKVRELHRNLRWCIRHVRDLGRDQLADALQAAVERYF